MSSLNVPWPRLLENARPRGARDYADQRRRSAIAAISTRQPGAKRRRRALVAELALADGIILGSPGYLAVFPV